jgi:uncharacterized protein (TIGR03437 family)
VESAALLDGDVISFMPPDSPSSAPRIRMHIPEGTVAAPPPPPPEAEEAPGEAPASGAPAGEAPASEATGPAPPPVPLVKPAPRRKRKPSKGLQVSAKVLAFGAGGLVLVGLLAWAASLFLFTSAPELSGVTPGQAEPGATITLRGSGFASSAEGNTVRFGGRSAPAQAVAGGGVLVKVPASLKAGVVPVTIETSGGRSNPVKLEVLAAVKASGLDPAGALPGDEVLLRGSGFEGETLSLTVGGAEAAVLETVAEGVRFTMPPLEAAAGSEHPVVVTVDGRSAPPASLIFGRLPLVTSFEPARAVAGDRVRIAGLGFAEDPARNAVTFDGVPALLLSATPKQIEVVAPVPRLAQRETLAQVVVQSSGKTSSGAVFPLLRLTSGSYVLRFFAASEEGAGRAAFVSTEIGPVLMLTGKGSAPSVALRALRVAEALNQVIQRPGQDRPVFEARDEPSIGVGLAGGPGVLMRATPQDAAAYQNPPGVAPRGGPPTPVALARWWAAVLNDYVVITTSPGQPSHVAALSPSAGATMTRARSALAWQYRSKVPNRRVAGLSANMRRQLRATALQVP